MEDILSEEALLEILDISKDTLGALRNRKGFPFIPLNRTSRVYLADDVHFWMERNRVEQPSRERSGKPGGGNSQ
jgi:hypothetical protein